MTGDWRRDVVPMQVCSCEHPLESHRIDLKSVCCGRCACPGFDLAERRWHEHRWVTEQVKP